MSTIIIVDYWRMEVVQTLLYVSLPIYIYIKEKL